LKTGKVSTNWFVRTFAPLRTLSIGLSLLDGIEEFTALRHPKKEEMGDRTIPFGKTVYIERSDFFDLEGPEGKANDGKAPKGYKRLLPGGMVRLRYAYVLQCNEIVRDAETQEPIELKCTYFPDTRAGVTPEGMKRVKGIIHWVEASKGIEIKVNQYDRLFLAKEPGKKSGNHLDDLNPESLEVLKGVFVEPSVADDAIAMSRTIEEAAENGKTLYPASLAYQFERSGYFALDKDSTDGKNLIFNRVVTLRDTWGVNDNSNQNKGRSRGRGQRGQKKQGGGSNVVVEDVRRVAFRAATILEAGPHPEADSLLVCKVDCGDVSEDGTAEPRTVVAGLAGKIPLGNMIGKQVVAVTNLKPAKMRGIESTAMLLAASDGSEGDSEQVELLMVPEGVPNGELLNIEGRKNSEPDAMMKSKGALKAFDRVKAALKANGDGEATWLNEDSSYKLITSQGPVKTTSLKDTIIQ
jgi:methionine--tRNA ligase beta chain